jgi:signal transduction histidine kinase
LRESSNLLSEMTHSEAIKGVGLGLAIVRELLARHGGKAWVRSSNEEGTTFFFSII